MHPDRDAALQPHSALLWASCLSWLQGYHHWPHFPCAAAAVRAPLPKLHVYQYLLERVRQGAGEVMLWCRYDMTRANLVDPELEKYVQRGLSLPDVVLVSVSLSATRDACHCIPACLSPTAAGQHDSGGPHSSVLHCWVFSSGQLFHLLLRSGSPALTKSTWTCSIHAPQQEMWGASQLHVATPPQSLHS